MGFQAILTSEFFGLRSALDNATLAKIDRKRELTFKENKTEEEQLEIIGLDQELGKLDFSKAVRDPLYMEFMRAITEAQRENPAIAYPAPTVDDWQRRKQVAEDIIKRIRG